MANSGAREDQGSNPAAQPAATSCLASPGHPDKDQPGTGPQSGNYVPNPKGSKEDMKS